MKHMFMPMMAGSVVLALAGCSDNKADTIAVGPEASVAASNTGTMGGGATAPAANDHAAQFLTDAMKGDNGEVRVGKLAAIKGSSQGVKDYGQMLADDHGSHLTKVTSLAQSMNVPVTTETKPESDALYAKLQGLSGAAFDNAFLDGMVEDHQKDIAAFQQEAGSKDSAEVTNLAQNTVPTLQKHLKTAQSLQAGK